MNFKNCTQTKALLFLILPVFLLLSLSDPAYSQTKSEPVNFPSPNASGMGEFGEYNLNKFIGSPDIRIPLYEVVEGNISLPLSLSYDVNQIKPNNHPGWTGQGFNLNGIGSITRVVNRGLDEQIYSGRKIGFYDNYASLAPSDWWTVAKLKTYTKTDPSTGTGLYVDSPDEFNFNVLNYSGRFYMDTNGKWVVISNDDIQVEFDPLTGFVGPTDLMQSTSNQNWRIPMSVYDYNLQSRFFNKFTLITPEGIRCEFGGINATEFSTNYRKQKDYPSISPTTWYLTKLSYHGKSIELNYKPDRLFLCSLIPHYEYWRSSKKEDTSWDPYLISAGCDNMVRNFLRNPAEGFLIFPVYLTSIKTSNVEVIFEKSTSKEQRNYIDDLKPASNEDGNNFVICPNTDSIQWRQLDRIKIKTANSKIFKVFEFNYTNSLSTRLKLLSIQEKDSNNIALPPYKFYYNSTKMAMYGTDSLDHWGYNSTPPSFNSTTLFEKFRNYTASREPDTTGKAQLSDLLYRIDFSLGGHTLFEYEPHTYTKVINIYRNNFIKLNKDKIAGGVRVKRISSYTSENSTPLVKEYYYVKNYSGQQNISDLPSSGVLGGQIQYYWLEYNGKNQDNDEYNLDIFSSGSVLPFGLNSHGSHIGYTEVIEKTINNGFTKYTFTNFDTPVRRSLPADTIYPYMDEQPLAVLESNRSVFSPCTRNSDWRGRLSTVEVYNKYNQKVKEVRNTYARFSNTYVKGLEIGKLPVCNFFHHTYTATAYKIYKDPPMLASVVEKTYSTSDLANEARAFTTSKTFVYNSKRLVKKIISEESDSTQTIVLNKYPFEYNVASEPALTNMASDAIHIINPIVEQEIWKKNEVGNELLISGNLNQFGNNYLPAATYKIEDTRPNTTTLSLSLLPDVYQELFPPHVPYVKQSDAEYDQYGNIIQYQLVGNPRIIYLWSYNYSFPVARILNATKQEVAAALNYTSFDDLTKAIGGNYSAAIQDKVNSLRTLLPDKLITTYSYNPLIGLTTTTDENGKTITYDYDNFHRLLSIKDPQLNILKAFKYNFRVKE